MNKRKRMRNPHYKGKYAAQFAITEKNKKRKQEKIARRLAKAKLRRQKKINQNDNIKMRQMSPTA